MNEGPNIAAVKHYIEQSLIAARQAALDIARGPGGREMALTITKLEEALHWLNEVKV